MNRWLLLLLCLSFSMSSDARALLADNKQNLPAREQSGTGACELHIWPSTRYGGIYFYAGGGYGTSLNLITSDAPVAAQKSYKAFGVEQQTGVLVDSIKRSGKFSGYNIIVHDPMPPERAQHFANLLEEPVGMGGREIESSTACYAEMHVTSVTVFRTALTKMLMTGFIVRYFPADPKATAVRVIHSRPKRGEERIGLSNFDFSSDSHTAQESEALAGAFRFMADRFLRKKVGPA